MSAAAIVVRQNRLMRHFREAGALDESSARTLEEIGERNSWIFRKMVQRNVFVMVGDGHYYMDELFAAQFVHDRRVRSLTLTAILLVVLVIVVIFTR